MTNIEKRKPTKVSPLDLDWTSENMIWVSEFHRDAVSAGPLLPDFTSTTGPPSLALTSEFRSMFC